MALYFKSSLTSLTFHAPIVNPLVKQLVGSYHREGKMQPCCCSGCEVDLLILFYLSVLDPK